MKLIILIGRPFVVVDDAVQNLTTAFAHRLQRLTGKTNFFIAKIGITISAVAVAVSIANFFFKFESHYVESHYVTNGGTFVVLDFVSMLYMLLVSSSLSKAEKEAATSTTRVMRAALYSPRWMRMYYIFSSVMNYFFWVDTKWDEPFLAFFRDSFSTGFCIFLYFVIVTPLPPQKSKIRQWIESLRPSMTPAEAS